MSKIHISFEPEALRPLIREVAAEVLAEIEEARRGLGDRIAFTEAEAARMLGLTERQLAEERRERGRINASQVVGGRIRYTMADLMEYLRSRRVDRVL